jgi:hypothetical protein
MTPFALVAGWLGVRLPAAFLVSWVVAQEVPDPTGGWLSILKQLGVALPFAVLCVVAMKELWKENRRLLALLLEAAPALAESNKALSENTETLASVAVLMHSLSGRPAIDMTELSIVKRMIREWDTRHPS